MEVNQLSLVITVHRHNILSDKKLGEIGPAVPLITVLTQPKTFQDCLLPLQNSGAVVGKVRVNISFN